MMTPTRVISVALILLLAISGGWLVLGEAEVLGASATCVGLMVLTPNEHYTSVNLRSSPQVADDNVVGVLGQGQTAQADSLANGWYHLPGVGYVSASVVIQASCATLTPTEPQPLLVITHANLLPDVVIVMGTAIPCTDPCAILIYGQGTPPLPTPTRIVATKATP